MAFIDGSECEEKTSVVTEKTSKWIEFQDLVTPSLLLLCITGMVVLGLIGAYPNVLHIWKNMQKYLDSATCRHLSPQDAEAIKADGIDCSINKS